jgi:hypothetical protein
MTLISLVGPKSELLRQCGGGGDGDYSVCGGGGCAGSNNGNRAITRPVCLFLSFLAAAAFGIAAAAAVQKKSTKRSLARKVTKYVAVK